MASNVEFDLNLVLEELFTNTLKHGGANGMAPGAHVEIKLDGGDVVVLFADHGIEFNPLQAPSPDLRLPLGQRTAGGLGIHLVRQVMRDLTYERVEGWNRITMRRIL